MPDQSASGSDAYSPSQPNEGSDYATDHACLLSDGLCSVCLADEARLRRASVPSLATVDTWRRQLEAVACGPVEGVWSGLTPVIQAMRDAVAGTEGRR